MSVDPVRHETPKFTDVGELTATEICATVSNDVATRAQYSLSTTGNSMTITFRRLLVELADRIGSQHFPVCENASDIAEVLRPDAVHAELIKRVVRDVYRANHCGHLDASIDSECTFDALGKIRGAIARHKNTDIDQLNLLEDIGSQLSDLFETRPATAAPGANGSALPQSSRNR
ncbi:MAG: hypothetical protein OEQ39_05050 [Gammaproteobacteria bacterium]|nr:hypothetical protein [Gammaproteobacteria bacterium]MDH3468653.1 hypothetical protein [Gammaproteobacteria bacterium]